MRPVESVTPAQQAFRVALGRAMRSERHAVHRSQSAVAQAVGITQASLSNYELGKRDVSVWIFNAWIAALDADPFAVLQDAEAASRGRVYGRAS
jgi:transcriptional regulator with XRE-family HTH domain